MIDSKKKARRAEMERRGCKDCLFFDPETKRCQVGMKHCVLPETQDPVGRERSQKIPLFPCSRCPYGQCERPCVSFCMKKLLKEWREERGSPEGRELMMHEP